MPIFINARGVSLSTSAASLHHFSATHAGPLLEGSAASDTMWGDSKVTVTMAGGAGDDIYHLYSERNAALEEAGNGTDSVFTWMSYTLPAHIENLTVTGNGRQAVGNALDNIIAGAGGAQTLDGGAGNDVLIGYGGADVFAMQAGNGSDLILDFTAEDSVRLTGYGISSFSQVASRLTQQGDDAALDLGKGEVLVFADTAADDLSAEQFALQVDLSEMTLTFADEFDSLSLGEGGTWDSNFWWGAENGSTLESQASWYIDTPYAPTRGLDPFSVSNGLLSITAQSVPAKLQPFVNGYDYASGMLTSFNSFSQTYGYFEMRADMPEGSGIWPAFWLLPADGDWPPELDVIELSGAEPQRLIMTAHSQESGSHTIDRHHAEVAETDGFHKYGVLWDPERIAWTYDGVVVAEAETPSDMHEPMYMLVNLGLGGFTGTPQQSAIDAGLAMKVDYIRAYGFDGEELPEPPPVGGPTPQLPDNNGGNDTITGTAAADRLVGGDGNDLLLGLAGDDLLFGNNGNDTMQGGGGLDTYDGGAGRDTVTYAGATTGVAADLGTGIVNLYNGDEQLLFIEDLIGGSGNDTLTGDAGENRLDGGAGNDLLFGLAEEDLLFGGAGDDTLQGGGGDDHYDGGAGRDTVTFAGAGKSLTVDLAAGLATFDGGRERLESIENVIGGSAGDTLAGDAGANRLDGGAGNDLLRGFGGNDTLIGGAGRDSFAFGRLDLAGGDGANTILDFSRSQDRLSFSDLVDTDDDGGIDLDDLLGSVSSVTDAGRGSSVTVAFDNGASISFAGAGTGATRSLTDLVDDAATQIQVS